MKSMLCQRAAAWLMSIALRKYYEVKATFCSADKSLSCFDMLLPSGALPTSHLKAERITLQGTPSSLKCRRLGQAVRHTQLWNRATETRDNLSEEHQNSPSQDKEAPACSRRTALAATTFSAALSLPGNALADSDANQTQGKASPPAGALREYKMVMRITALRGSVPQEWVSDFQTALDGFGVAAMTQRPQLTDIYSELRGTARAGWAKGKPPTTFDAVTVGDVWLERGIREGLLQPIAGARQYRWWSLLPPRWRRLVSRDAQGRPSPQGEVWGAPYRWGCTLVAYNKDRLLRRGGTPIRDWADLLQPGLKGRLGFVDSPREFFGVAVKTLGLPLNASAQEMHRRGVTPAALRERVQQLRQQVRVFSNSDHVRALGQGDVLAVVGWSEDLLSLRATNVAVVAPSSGTPLWADLWCIPAQAAGGARDGEPSPLLPAWMELPLQPVRAQPSKGLKGGASPLLLPPSATPKQLPEIKGEGLAELSGLGAMPLPQVLAHSEFLLPLDDDTIELYNSALR